MIESSEESIRGITLISTIIIFILDLITIDNHHTVIFTWKQDSKKPENKNQNNIDNDIDNVDQIKNVDHIENDDKSFIVDDVKTVYTAYPNATA